MNEDAEPGVASRPAGLIDPDYLGSSAREIACLAAATAASAGHGIRRHIRGVAAHLGFHFRPYAAWTCWTACFLAWPTADGMQELGWIDKGFRGNISGAVLVAAPFLASLIMLRRAERVERAGLRAAFLRKAPRAVIVGDRCDERFTRNSARLNEAEEAIASIYNEVRMIREGLSAACVAAGMTDARPHLSLVPREPVTGPILA